MAEKLFLIKVPDGAIVKMEDDAVAINMNREKMALILSEAKPVEELTSWADICKADKVFAVKEGS